MRLKIENKWLLGNCNISYKIIINPNSVSFYRKSFVVKKWYPKVLIIKINEFKKKPTQKECPWTCKFLVVRLEFTNQPKYPSLNHKILEYSPEISFLVQIFEICCFCWKQSQNFTLFSLLSNSVQFHQQNNIKKTKNKISNKILRRKNKIFQNFFFLRILTFTSFNTFGNSFSSFWKYFTVFFKVEPFFVHDFFLLFFFIFLQLLQKLQCCCFSWDFSSSWIRSRLVFGYVICG